jgi:hypothetical protein
MVRWELDERELGRKRSWYSDIFLEVLNKSTKRKIQ